MQQHAPHGETTYDQQSNHGGQSTHIGWAIGKRVGSLHIAMHATFNTGIRSFILHYFIRFENGPVLPFLFVAKF